MMIPLLIPGLAHAFPDGAESLHYSSCEFQTRVTEMKVITQARQPRHADPDRSAGAARARRNAFRGTPSTTRSNTTCSPRRRTRSSPSRRSRPTTRTSTAARRSRTCATSGAMRSSSTGACRRRSTPPIEGARIPGGVMAAAVLTSTTSHKREPLLPTLELFATPRSARPRSEPAPHPRGRCLC